MRLTSIFRYIFYHSVIKLLINLNKTQNNISNNDVYNIFLIQENLMISFRFFFSVNSMQQFRNIHLFFVFHFYHLVFVHFKLVKSQNKS